MANPTQNEIGYSIKLPGAIGDTATLPAVLDTFYQNTDGAFAIIFDVCFQDDNYNVFFGGSQAASSFKLMRNKTANKIDLELIDEAANTRSYTWDKQLEKGVFYNFIINGVGSGADGIEFFLNSTAQNASAQTNDVGYSPTVSMPLKFGDIDATNLGGAKVANPHLYARSLTAAERALIKSHRIYPSDFFRSWKFKRPNIGLNHSIAF